jgi:hypothetical protein
MAGESLNGMNGVPPASLTACRLVVPSDLAGGELRHHFIAARQLAVYRLVCSQQSLFAGSG